jgi:hypothetical protein
MGDCLLSGLLKSCIVLYTTNLLTYNTRLPIQKLAGASKYDARGKGNMFLCAGTGVFFSQIVDGHVRFDVRRASLL